MLIVVIADIRAQKLYKFIFYVCGLKQGVLQEATVHHSERWPDSSVVPVTHLFISIGVLVKQKNG